MQELKYKILSSLKSKLIAQIGNKPFQLAGIGPNLSARQFYLTELNDNLAAPMSQRVIMQYSSGSGSELTDKMHAVHSSSAMCYNLLGNNCIHFLENTRIGQGIYAIDYEWQYHTLSKEYRGTPANLDTFLYCEDTKEAVACEMKLTEWLFNPPGNLKAAYLNPSCYSETLSGQVFTNVARMLIMNTDQLNKLPEYNPIFTRYDGMQVFKHSIALYNACKEGKIDCKKVTLVNCVWEADLTDENYISALNIEHKEFDLFCKAMSPVKSLFASIGVDFDICYYSLFKFMNMIYLSGPEKNYLERYRI